MSPPVKLEFWRLSLIYYTWYSKNQVISIHMEVVNAVLIYISEWKYVDFSM